MNKIREKIVVRNRANLKKKFGIVMDLRPFLKIKQCITESRYSKPIERKFFQTNQNPEESLYYDK